MRARLPKEYAGGGAKNMNAMIRQAQKIQDDIAKIQQEIDESEFNASVGGGVVEVVMTGKKELKEVIIKPEVVDPDDVEMLQDLVMSAVNEVIRTIEKTTEDRMEKATGGMSLPGMF